MKTLEEIRSSEVDEGFITHMSNDMCMSFFKYGHINDYVGKHSIEYINKEMEAFNKDHNTEHMVNIANYAMIRYMFPQANESYNPTSSDKSTHNNK